MTGWPAAASAIVWSLSAGTAPLTPTAPTIRPSSTTGTPPLPKTNGSRRAWRRCRRRACARGEALLEVERARAEAGGGVGLGAGDLGRHPERAVHPVAGDQVAGLVDDGDRDLEAQLAGALAMPRAMQARACVERERRVTARSTQTSPPSMRTGYDGTGAAARREQALAGAHVVHPAVPRARQPACPPSLPSLSGPPWCVHTSPQRVAPASPTRTSTTRVPSSSTERAAARRHLVQRGDRRAASLTASSLRTKARWRPLMYCQRISVAWRTGSSGLAPAARASCSGARRSGSRARRGPRRPRCGWRRTPPRGR